MKPVQFLLVDDLKENLLSLEALLRRDDLVLLKARSGDEALELLLLNDVALALVDVQMPGLNGYELAEMMRGNERTRHVPIIFVTAGSSDNQRRFRGYEAGAVDFIQKPIEPDILRSKASVFFELYRQRQQIGAQRDELKAQADELKQADRRKDEFLATLAHELRNPLVPLRHGLDILRQIPPGKDSTEIRATMDRQLMHLTRLIDDLLDVSRVSEGKIELRRQIVEVAEIVRSALETSRPLIDAARHGFILDLPEKPIWLDADPMRLSQVVSNLLNNAAKYTPEGGTIELSVRAAGDSVSIAVSDSGVGIPEDKQSEIFQLFAQVEHHLHRAQGGLGIGLALVRQLVTMHGGTVEAQSAGMNKGSVFTVRLPTVPGLVAPVRQTETGPGTSAAQGLKVLVVDDNLDVAQTVGWMLEAMGHEYRLVHDGRDALEAARQFRPDAILLDIGLPGLDGYAVCRLLREDELFKTIPIIAQSGWGHEEDKAQSSASGFDHHLIKPVGIATLETIFADIAAAKSKADENAGQQ